MSINESLKKLTAFSNRYGSDEDFVLAGGGNTSAKDDSFIYVKGSGTSLATIKEEQFVKMNRKKLSEIWEREYSSDADKREEEVLRDLMDSREKGEESKRPSVETLLHDLFPQRYVLHVHPAMINGITCSKTAKETVANLFSDAIYVEESEPGYVLAALCRKKLASYKNKYGKDASLLFLQNHGVFFASSSEKGLDSLVSDVMKKIKKLSVKKADFKYADAAPEAEKISPVLKMLYSSDGKSVTKYYNNKQIRYFASSKENFKVISKPLTPDHIVYCKAEPLFLADTDISVIKEKFNSFTSEKGYMPKVIFVKDIGMFVCASDMKEAETTAKVWFDAMKIACYAQNFGGVSPMKKSLADFIVNWEVEKYRSKVSITHDDSLELSGKIALITGSAQGFGEGIARYLASKGAYVVIADMNEEGAKKTAQSISEESGRYSLPLRVNVSDEESVINMVKDTVLTYGGIDIFINNAGIVRAGSLDEMKKSDFDLVTAVNYSAYFLCTKYVSAVMKIQRAISEEYMSDIIEINSKSGLTGSNKNFAYAGSKFGGLGLTQSFALELAPFGIKVNAVCPGNFLDGPLWSDPDRGLFVQYLKAGKVPGAKSVADVKKYYESKVPLGRGCRIEDVAKAVTYIISQKYETGQAVPVTGGQEMLN